MKLTKYPTEYCYVSIVYTSTELRNITFRLCNDGNPKFKAILRIAC